MLTDLTTATEVTLPDGDLVEVLTEGANLREQFKSVILVRPAFLERTWIDDAVEVRGAMPTPFTDLDACAHLGIVRPQSTRTEEPRSGTPERPFTTPEDWLRY